MKFKLKRKNSNNAVIKMCSWLPWTVQLWDDAQKVHIRRLEAFSCSDSVAPYPKSWPPHCPPQTRSPRTATDFINDYDKCRLNFLLHKAFASCRKWHQMSLLSASHVISRCCNVIALVGALVKPETEE